MPAGVQTALHGVTKIEVKKRRTVGSNKYFKFYDTVHVVFHYKDGTYDVAAFCPMDQAVEIVNDPR